MGLNKKFLLEGQVVIVTGAGGGLGAEITKILAEANSKIIMVDLNANSMKGLAEELRCKGKSILIQECDITKKSDISILIDNIQDKYQSIDVLINCAGVLGADAGMFDVEGLDWDNVIDVNLKGTWNISTEVTRYMIKKGIKGRVVNISSSLGNRAQLRRIHYATSKAGVEHLTRNMAMELVRYGIRVNCLAPGWMATPMVKEIIEGANGGKWCKAIPMGRVGEPEELTGALLLLASEASSYMTGSILRVDGGYAYNGIELET